jgi:Transglycosylase-like domain
VALLVTCTLVLSAPALAAAATRPRDQAGDAQSRVDAARRTANASAGRYMEALGVFERLRVQAVGYESAIAEGERRAATLRSVVQQRAARAYRGAGTSLPSLLTVGDLPDLMRSDKLLATANVKDADALSLLLAQQEDLKLKREDLRKLEDRQSGALLELQRSSKRADAQLAAALSDRQDVQARLAAQAAATRIRVTRTTSTPTTAARTTSAPPPRVSVPAPPSRAGSGSHHNDPFLSCVRQRESRGNYGVINPAGPWYGAYQFLASTWNITARHAGRLDLVGVLPSNASASDQDDMAWTLYQWQGSGPWGGSC